MNGDSPVLVAVGVVRNERRQILIAKRPDNKPHGGCWEFPGGKIRPRESIEEALSRELQEELNLTPLRSRRLINIRHDYDEYPVLLDVRLVYQWRGEVHGREGQEIRWVDDEHLSGYSYPAANAGILLALKLPALYYITPETDIGSADFLVNCEKILAAGCRMIQFRCKNRSFSQTTSVFNKLSHLCDDYNTRLVLNGTVEEALNAGASGCHLSSKNLKTYKAGSIPEGFVVGASCHNRDELHIAESKQLDFAVLGPVRPTTSHPDAVGLGWEEFSHLVAGLSLPVYAIGGMQMEDMPRAWEYGAQGLASISGIWQRVIVVEGKLSEG